MITFEPIKEETLEIVKSIVNSNASYNILENGNPVRTDEEIKNEFLNPKTECYLIAVDNQFVGVLDFLVENPKDGQPWLGLLMIHKDYHSMGYGKKAYLSFEKQLIERKFQNVRLGVLQDNEKAKKFWKSLGFYMYGKSNWGDKEVDCLEKHLLIGL